MQGSNRSDTMGLSSRCLQTARTLMRTRRCMSDIGRGTDLLADSLAFGEKRKVILDAYAPTGFDVLGTLERPTYSNIQQDPKENEQESQSNVVHMNGSIIAFPHACFLWNARGPKDVTLESLSAVMLHKPAIEFLFIGCSKTIPPRELNKIKRELKQKGIVVEQLDLTNAMGTFNILNGEDRRVAVALVMDAVQH